MIEYKTSNSEGFRYNFVITDNFSQEQIIKSKDVFSQNIVNIKINIKFNFLNVENKIILTFKRALFFIMNKNFHS